MILMSGDVTTIDAIEMADGEDVEVERVMDMSNLLETFLRPVSLVAYSLHLQLRRS